MVTLADFKFNDIGDLLSFPEEVTLDELTVIHDELINQRNYIRASRVNHLIMQFNFAS